MTTTTRARLERGLELSPVLAALALNAVAHERWPLTATELANTVCLTPKRRAASKQLSMPWMSSLKAVCGASSPMKSSVRAQ